MFHNREVSGETSFVRFHSSAGESHKGRTRGHLPYNTRLDIRIHHILQVSKACVVEKAWKKTSVMYRKYSYM
jgi:hypothetical protein